MSKEQVTWTIELRPYVFPLFLAGPGDWGDRGGRGDRGDLGDPPGLPCPGLAVPAAVSSKFFSGGTLTST